VPVKIKICGITNLADAEAAAAAGADLLGFVFYERSSRAVSLQAAAEIAQRLPPSVGRVGVFVDAPRETVLAAADACGLTLLQFHGQEPPEFCAGFSLPSMKAFRVKDRGLLEQLREYHTEYLLLDAYHPSLPGGSGETFDWEIAREAVIPGRRLFLAGGLTEANVGEAIRSVKPYGVDVSSGVEAAPGIKDHDRLARFIRAARNAGPAA
jgi:phosphoribosylanthranilate isomerase